MLITCKIHVAIDKSRCYNISGIRIALVQGRLGTVACEHFFVRILRLKVAEIMNNLIPMKGSSFIKIRESFTF